MSRILWSLTLTLCVGAGAAWAQSVENTKHGPPRKPDARLATKKTPGEATQRKRIVVRLANTPAIDVAKAINELLTGESRLRETDPNSTVPPSQAAVVIPDPITNSLVISATPRDLDAIKEIVEQLDRRPEMVMIKVLIAEITWGDAQTADGKDRRGDGKELANKLPIEGCEQLRHFLADRLRAEPEGPAGLVLKDKRANVDALAEAIRRCPGAKILGRPQVMTLDNQPAYIQVGQRIPTMRPAKTDKGTVTNVSYENTGLILGVTPRITPKGDVLMEIDVEYSQPGPVEEGIPISVSPDGKVIRSPRIDTTTARTTVSVPDGETLVLGGLSTNADSKRTELLILVTPQVVDPDKIEK